jgi:hypothetical protein
MTRDRYKQLLRFFVVNDPANDDNILDPAAHTSSFISHLNRTFSLYLTPSRFLTLDEFMVAYKGSADIVQFIPSKPHRFGYKVYGVASDNYVLKLELYRGAAAEKSEKGATYDLVMRMLADFPPPASCRLHGQLVHVTHRAASIGGLWCCCVWVGAAQSRRHAAHVHPK